MTASTAIASHRRACLRRLPRLVGTYGEDAVAKFVEGFPARIRNGEFSVALAKQ